MLSFNLSLAEEPVELDGKAYTLRELSGKGRERYINLQLAASDGGDKVTSVDGLVCGLVSLTLVDAAGVPVPQKVIEAWPSRVVDSLAEKARELSGLDSVEEGNGSQSPSEAGSG